MPNNAIGVQILGDPSSLERAFKRSEVAATEFNARMNTLGQTTRGAFSGAGFSKGSLLFGSTAFVGASIAAASLTTAVQAASDLNEQITKSQQVFGDSAKQIKKWSQSTATSFGISQEAALEASGTFGNLFRTVDLLPKQAAEMSQTLTELAADLASFNNADVNDVLLALRSGLIGEAEPLRRFGVLLSESRVQTEALAETGKKNARSLTDQEKALARYKIILEDTIPAQGDFQRTSDGLANQTRILKANLNDLAANIGSILIPTVSAATEAANLLFVALSKFRGVDFSPGFDFPEPPSWLKKGLALAPLSPLGAAVVAAHDIFSDDKKKINALTAFGDSINADLQKLAAVMEKRAEALRKLNKRNLARESKEFAENLKGLDLKLDKAKLTGAIDAQIAVLREQEQALLRQEAKRGKKFELEVALTSVRQDIQNLLDDKTRNALEKSRQAIQDVLDGFDLRLSKAQLTDTLADDLKVLNDELAAVRRLIAANADNADLKTKEIQLERDILDVKKQQTAETKAQFDAAKSRADQLFGSLFQARAEAERTITILGGSKSKQTVVLPGAGGGEDARGLLSDLTTQIKSFQKLQASILELQRKGAPKSLLEAARSGEISADQVNALADANQATLNKIFRNVRLADKLVSKAAKAEITAKDVNLHARTVTVKGAINSHGGGGPREEGFVINGGIHLHGVQNVKQLENELERRRKKRAQQTRGRSGGKR